MKNSDKENKKQLPINKVEDVEFSIDQADQEDLEALERSKKADKRQQSEN